MRETLTLHHIVRRDEPDAWERLFREMLEELTRSLCEVSHGRAVCMRRHKRLDLM
jgi:hypothetical protein